MGRFHWNRSWGVLPLVSLSIVDLRRYSPLTPLTRVDAQEQIFQQSRAVHISYHSRRDANNAYTFALSKQWVASTLDTEHPFIRRKTYSKSLVRPTTHMISASTPLGTGMARPTWYAVYVGIRPGVYDNL